MRPVADALHPAAMVEMNERMAGFKKLGAKGNVVHRVVLPGPTRLAGARRAGAPGSGLRGLNLDRARPGSPVAQPTPEEAVWPVPRRAAAESAPEGPSPAEARQSHRETELLQRRIDKLSRLLMEQEEQIRTLSERELDSQAEAPFYDAVKSQLPMTPPDEKRQAFMSQLFQANLELRESVRKRGS